MGWLEVVAVIVLELEAEANWVTRQGWNVSCLKPPSAPQCVIDLICTGGDRVSLVR